jgi:glucosamine--fructose-6-phosphate aminotransferase (isomerizing)
LREAVSLVTIGRGPTLAIAREAALKLKETCNLHAEAFSGAEFMHGPVTLVGDDFPILVFTPTDAGAEGLGRLAGSLREKGAGLFAAGEPALPMLRPTMPTPTRSSWSRASTVSPCGSRPCAASTSTNRATCRR